MPNRDPRTDAQLFREAIGADRGEVRALPATATPPAPPKPRPAARMAARDEALAREELRQLSDADLPEAGARGWLRKDVPTKTYDRLARGEFAIQDELVLDRLPLRLARRQIAGFLHDCRRRGLGCVRIVHRRDPADDAGRRGSACPIESALEHRNDVAAFHATDHGSGSTFVTLLLGGRRS